MPPNDLQLEASLWTSTLSPAFKRFGHFTRIESAVTESGIPDVHGSVDGVMAWIELKVVLRGYVVPMRKDQINWLRAEGKSGGRCFVLARRHDVIRIWEGSQAGTIRERSGWMTEPVLELTAPFDLAQAINVMYGRGFGTETPAEYLSRVSVQVLERRKALLSQMPRSECPGCFNQLGSVTRIVGWCLRCQPKRRRMENTSEGVYF